MSEAVPEQQEKVVMGDVLDVLRPYLNENIAAVNVSEEDYLAKYSEHHYEWVDGVLIQRIPFPEVVPDNTEKVSIKDILTILHPYLIEDITVETVRKKMFATD